MEQDKFRFMPFVISTSPGSFHLALQGTALRVLIADPQRRVRAALKTLLSHQSGIQVVADTAAYENLHHLIQVSQPELLLIDPAIADQPFETVLHHLREAYPWLCIVAMSGKAELQPRALAAGANRFVSKADPPDRLLNAILPHHPA